MADTDRLAQALRERISGLIESDDYGVEGSTFQRCPECSGESGAGILNKGITHEPDCSIGLDLALLAEHAALASLAPAAVEGEPVAWRYKDFRGHWKYRGADQTMFLKPEHRKTVEPLFDRVALTAQVAALTAQCEGLRYENKRWEYAAMHCRSRFKSESDVLSVKDSVNANIFAHNWLHSAIAAGNGETKP